MIAKFENTQVAKGYEKMVEESKKRLQQWTAGISEIPSVEIIDNNVCRSDGRVLIQGMLDLGYKEEEHPVFFQFLQGDQALLKDCCDCSGGLANCPASKAIHEYNGTWTEVYEKMLDLVKNRIDSIPDFTPTSVS